MIRLIIFGIVLFLVSCGQEPKKADIQPAIVEEYTGMPVKVQRADSTRSDTIPQEKEVKKAPTGQTIVNTYDEGYLDGEAMAEEDRLAGQPGMQVGMDADEDDDYEEGYDDGYDE